MTDSNHNVTFAQKGSSSVPYKRNKFTENIRGTFIRPRTFLYPQHKHKRQKSGFGKEINKLLGEQGNFINTTKGLARNFLIICIRVCNVGRYRYFCHLSGPSRKYSQGNFQSEFKWLSSAFSWKMFTFDCRLNKALLSRL